jgi:hypothetical protein
VTLGIVSFFAVTFNLSSYVNSQTPGSDSMCTHGVVPKIMSLGTFELVYVHTVQKVAVKPIQYRF